ncbi:MAG: hypothetical protein C0617_01995 [Desulfuromonas sp.]|uniref:hypothetical protein n=1 Tax=Desulfuromonas sp. TaxID=892 RepID=UPI000CB5F018|nr:hypothetical protein [Desulfuromonas sp.]PLX86154.1 MAG: hypothetical protein C0617_01995 [Desulfuromonas sp.]
MERARFIDHKGKRIFFLDFSLCTIEDAFSVIEEARDQIRSQPEQSVLTLTNAGGGRFDSAVLQKLKEFTKDNTPYVKTAAVVGVTGLQSIAFSAIRMFTRRNFHTFDDLEKAKDFLAGC